MPKVLMPLSNTDYQLMNTSRNEFYEIVEVLPEINQYFVINVTHRLAEVDWITEKLEEEVQRNQGITSQEGLLSLQMLHRQTLLNQFFPSFLPF